MTATRIIPENFSAIRGMEACRALSRATDEWLSQLFDNGTDGEKKKNDIALIAVGGYGRQELAPYSDIDVVLVHDSVKNISDIASKLWYPIWDAGLKLGHSVRTPKETAKLCATDLDTATALVTGRVIAGNVELGNAVIDAAKKNWQSQGRQWLIELHKRTLDRYADAGEVAFLLEPNLKEGYGGLRDIHTLGWAVEAGLDLLPGDAEDLQFCHDVLLNVRVALHRHSGKPTEILRLEDQRSVAELSGYESDDELMAAIAYVGRRVAWIADEVWARLDPPANRSSQAVSVATGVQVVQGEVHLEDSVNSALDPTLLLRVATAAARLGLRIDRTSLDRLAEGSPVWPDPWPAGAIDDLVALLLEGEAAIPVLESLDQRNLLVRVLPEWEPVRSKPQRNAFHRYTVDRHLWQAVANAAGLVHRVTRPDLLVIAALFHDLGKGYPGDHTEVGVELFAKIGPRMGLNSDDQAVVSSLIDHHLLLADTATRRDLSDDATISMVAEKVKSVVVLDLLHALTEADSKATGPSAWSTWKAELIQVLVDRVRHVLGGGDVQEVMWRLFPDADVLALMGQREIAIRAEDDRVTVVSPDQPGTFSKVSGVLSLSGLDVLGAEAHSDEQGMAASQFRIVPPAHGIDWNPIIDNLHKALQGRLALDSRLADRAATYRARRVLSAQEPAAPTVRFDNAASSNATYVEVRAPDAVGILYSITKAMADIGLDIRHARVLTLGNEVVDSFYVSPAGGGRIEDETYRQEISRAILFAISSLSRT
ncbi:MAG: protein-PII uridylyltransferase GlnD [Actinomycetota bacterium]